MKFVSVRDFRGKSAQIWKQLAKLRELVITSNGKPIAILSPTTEDQLEESLAMIRRAHAMQAVRDMQVKSVEKGFSQITLDEINGTIRSVRKERGR